MGRDQEWEKGGQCGRNSTDIKSDSYVPRIWKEIERRVHNFPHCSFGREKGIYLKSLSFEYFQFFFLLTVPFWSISFNVNTDLVKTTKPKNHHHRNVGLWHLVPEIMCWEGLSSVVVGLIIYKLDLVGFPSKGCLQRIKKVWGARRVNSFPAPILASSTASGSRFPSALQRPHGAKIGVAKRTQEGQTVFKVGVVGGDGKRPMRHGGNFD